MNRTIETYKKIIDDNPAISLRAMAKQFGYACQSSLTAYFKTHAGMTPLQYRARVRITRACHLLATTTKRVCDISLEVGYGSTTAFCLFFRDATGLTPLQYRAQHQGIARQAVPA